MSPTVTVTREYRDALIAEREDLKAELQGLRAQNATMRDSLASIAQAKIAWEHVKDDALIAAIGDLAVSALSTTPPTSYVSKEAVRPLVEALQKAQDFIYNGYAPVRTIKEALTTSRQLGLLE